MFYETWVGSTYLVDNQNKSTGSWLGIANSAFYCRDSLCTATMCSIYPKFNLTKHDLSPTSGLCLWFLLGWLLFFGRFRCLHNWRSSERSSMETREETKETIVRSWVYLSCQELQSWPHFWSPQQHPQKCLHRIYDGNTLKILKQGSLAAGLTDSLPSPRA